MLSKNRLLTLPLPLLLALAACGGSSGGLIVDNAPPPPKAAPEPPKVPDAWRDHRGDHVKLGQKFRIANKPIAVDGPNVVITLSKVDWSTMTTPSGKEVKEGAAQVAVTKGEDTVTGLIPQGDFKRIHGVKFSSIGCGEEYNKHRLVYEPWVELIATAEE